GVSVETYRQAKVNPQWQGRAHAPSIVFLGRVEESRKGLPVLLEAVDLICEEIPGSRFYVAGNGTFEYNGKNPDAVISLGSISESEKAVLLSSADFYCAPQTGGESFGIVLVE